MLTFACLKTSKIFSISAGYFLETSLFGNGALSLGANFFGDLTEFSLSEATCSLD